MGDTKKRLTVIFHSGSYDRIYNGLTTALTALSIGREVKMLFTYWSLEYIMKDSSSEMTLDSEAEHYRTVLEQNTEKGRLVSISELFSLTKKLGGKMYGCIGSMELLGMSASGFIDEIDKSIGMPEFLKDAGEDQLLFI